MPESGDGAPRAVGNAGIVWAGVAAATLCGGVYWAVCSLGPPGEAAARAHGINIKLAKSGGIREAVRMAHAARALGLGVMLGCMVESSLGIAAAAQLASLCDHVDLDGNLLLGDDPWEGVDFVDGVQLPSAEPGLGVNARQEVSGSR